MTHRWAQSLLTSSMMRMIEALRRLFRRRGTMQVPTDPRHQLSQNFTLGEMLKSQTATRKGIDNTPDLEQFKNLQALCQNVLQPVRGIYGVPLIVTSGLRVLELNRAIGSWDGSQHTKGEAADFEPLGNIALEDLWRSIVLSDIPYDQCILEFPPTGWIHISHKRDGDQRGKITVARKVDGKTRYDHYTREQVEQFDWE